MPNDFVFSLMLIKNDVFTAPKTTVINYCFSYCFFATNDVRFTINIRVLINGIFGCCCGFCLALSGQRAPSIAVAVLAFAHYCTNTWRQEQNVCIHKFHFPSFPQLLDRSFPFIFPVTAISPRPSFETFKLQ